MENENKKAFIRLLKELGLYFEWIRLRKAYIAYLITVNHKNSNYGLLNDLPDNFGSILTHSFVWAESNYPIMWRDLATLFPIAVRTPSEIIQDEDALNRLKYIIKTNTLHV